MLMVADGLLLSFAEAKQVSRLLILLCCIVRWPGGSMAAPVDNESDYYDQDDPVADIEQDFVASSSAPSSGKWRASSRLLWLSW